MIDVKLLIEEVLNEIAIADEYDNSYDAQLKPYVVGVYDRPPVFEGDRNDKAQFGQYLRQVQDWAARNLDEVHTSSTFDLKSLRWVDAEPEAIFDDSYRTFDDFVEDQIHPVRYIRISPGHIARYVLGEDIAPRVVIPGRR